MEMLQKTLLEVWMVAGQMSPYLLLGFLIAGILSVFISPELVEAHLGKRGLWQVCKAALLGVPLPLCSCGVLPVSASLRQHGASKGATLSFLASTPQTGLDSIMVTHALLGPVVVVFRIVTAFVSGIMSGVLVELSDSKEDVASEKKPDCACCGAHDDSHGKLYTIFHYGFVVLARDIGTAMLVGILLAGVMSALIPPDYFADKLGGGFTSMLIMMVIGIPIYACSAGSVPIAFALMGLGVSPGAALVFLVTGPATNAATITTLWRLLGKRPTLIYLFSIAFCALVAGLLLDVVMTTPAIDTIKQCVHHDGSSLFNNISAVVLFIVLLPGLVRKKSKS
ncbi:MAG: permease [Kiritimatiellae bacterium]|nr:permease [Kiritimatiellia bacterium]